MSPTPARTSRDAITEAARAILEEDGLDAVSMQAVAERVGVRAPSLYKHVADRSTLIRAVTDAVTADLAMALRPPTAAAGPAVTSSARSPAAIGRSCARTRWATGCSSCGSGPGCCPTSRSSQPWASRSSSDQRAWSGRTAALDAARTFVAWAHGFTSLELAGGFRMGGDIDAAFANGIDLILAGISERATPSSA